MPLGSDGKSGAAPPRSSVVPPKCPTSGTDGRKVEFPYRRGAESNTAIDLHQELVVFLCGIFLFVFASGFSFHRSCALLVEPGPVNLLRQIRGITGTEKQSGTVVIHKFLHSSARRCDHGNSAGKGL